MPKYLTTKEAVKKAFPNKIEKLEIGSGANPEIGYTHLDIQPGLPHLDIVSDVRSMPIPTNFVTGEVRAVHIMEHFCHPEFAGKELIHKYGTTVQVLKEVYRVLAPGGKIKIVTPDFEKIAKSTAKKRVSFDWLQRWTVGGHLNEYDVHHWLWTHADAERWLTQVGFHSVQDWNPIQGWRQEMKLDWNTPDEPGNTKWHNLEWYHWLFIEAEK